jgi:XTP/dITP diphosphohydrolase
VRFVVASANPHKVAELRQLLAESMPDVELLPRPVDVPDVVEDADTLLGNARLKAHALARATGEAAIADDTGLFVDALDGRPGVHTARYAGENADDAANRARLLDELALVGGAPAARRARFHTVALAAWPDGTEIWAEGVVEGAIADAERGTGGFGYDPVFCPDGHAGLTFSELGLPVKQQISHRGRAVRALAVLLTR